MEQPLYRLTPTLVAGAGWVCIYIAQIVNTTEFVMLMRPAIIFVVTES